MAIRSPSMSSERAFSQGALSVPEDLDRCVLSPTAPLPLDLQDCPALHNFSIRPASDTRYESAFSTVARSLLRSSSQQMATRTISSSLQVAMQASSRRSSSVSGITVNASSSVNRSVSYEKGSLVQRALLLKEKLGQVPPERTVPAALFGITDQAESQESSSSKGFMGVSDAEFAEAQKEWEERQAKEKKAAEDDKVRSIVNQFIQNSSPRLRAVQYMPSTPSSKNKSLILQRISEYESEKENQVLLAALPFIAEEVAEYPKPGFVRRRDPDVSADRLPNETYEQYLDRVFPVSKETYPREHIDLEPPATAEAIEAFIRERNQAPQETIPVFGSVRTIVSEELPACGLNESVQSLLARFCPKIPDPTFERIDKG